MKNLLGRLLGAFLFLALLGGVIAAVFLSTTSLDQKIEQQIRDIVHAQTGREFAFSGAQFVFWPYLALQIRDVSLGNAPGSKDKDMIALDRLSVELALKPLFQRHVEVRRITLDSPVIHLETAPDGTPNWDFSQKEKPPARQETAEKSAAEDFTFSFGKVQVNDAQLTFVDGRKKTTEVFSDVDIGLRLPDFQGALQASGALDYKKKRMRFRVEMEKPAEFLAAKPSPGSVEISTAAMEARMSGTIASRGTLLDGKIEAAIPSLSGLAAWWRGGKKENLPFEKITFSSAVKADGGRLALGNARLSLDGIEASGDVNIGFAGKPDIFARLNISKIDLDRFMGETTGASSEGRSGASAAAREGWSAAPLDFSGLNSLNVDVILLASGFSLKGAEVGPSTLTATLKDGNFRFVSSEAALFGGRFSSDFALNAVPQVPVMTFKFSMNGVQAQPVLTTFAHFKKLSGTADAQVSVHAAGGSQKEFVEKLEGSGSVTFKNGAFEGIDLVNIAKGIQNRLTDMGVGEGKTEFVDLGGTFKIIQGVAQNDDLKMRGPLVQATGAGRVDLPRKSVQYRVIPVLTASSAVEGAAGLKVPVDIKGPFSNIKVKPDYAAVVQQALENPGEIKATVKNVRQQGKEILKEIKKDPNKALESLLGGALFGAPAPQSEPQVPAPAP